MQIRVPFLSKMFSFLALGPIGSLVIALSGTVGTDAQICFDEEVVVEGEILGVYPGVITSIVEHDVAGTADSANSHGDSPVIASPQDHLSTSGTVGNEGRDPGDAVAVDALPSLADDSTVNSLPRPARPSAPTKDGSTDEASVQDSGQGTVGQDAEDDSLAQLNEKIDHATAELLRLHRETKSFAEQGAAVRKQLEHLSKLTKKRDKKLQELQQDVSKNKRAIRDNSRRINEVAREAKQATKVAADSQRQLSEANRAVDEARQQAAALEKQMRQAAADIRQLTEQQQAQAARLEQDRQPDSISSLRTDSVAGNVASQETTEREGTIEPMQVRQLHGILERLEKARARIDQLSTVYDKLLADPTLTETVGSEAKESITQGWHDLRSNQEQIDKLEKRVSEMVHGADQDH